MRKLLFAPAIIALCAFAATPSRHLRKVVNAKTSIAYAKDGNGKILDTASISADGQYQFKNLPKGTYTVVIKSQNRPELEIKNVEHAGTYISYHIVSEMVEDEDKNSSSSLSKDADHEVERVAMHKSLTRSPAVTSDGFGSGAPTTAPIMEGTRSETMMGGLATRGTRPTGGTSGLKPGQITAGIWRDLDHWDKWAETNKDAAISGYQNTWGFYFNERFSTRFTDQKGKAIVGMKVELVDNFNVVHWEAVTDNKGNAELFANLNAEIVTKVLRQYKVKTVLGERSFDFDVKPNAGGSDVFALPVTYMPNAIADVAFVVDATGSMGDEINYLQSELLDVATRVKKTNKCLELRTGSVFYRDHGDAYLTVNADFNTDVTKVVNFIYEQQAGGGGDFPEAVDAAMEASVEGLSWSENSVAKLLFLVLDAPPHEDSASKMRMQKYTKMAAKKGIKIIPITASGINQSTEFLMKYLANATNGNYVYITDHSGIGNAHEKPTGVKENVQYLNDLMVDIINENTQWDGCKDSTQTNPNQQQGTVEIVTNGQWQVQFYPNPAVDQIMIKSNEIPEEIGIYNLRGEEVKKVSQIQAEKTTIDIREIPTGIYIVRCRKGEKQLSCRILVMK